MMQISYRGVIIKQISFADDKIIGHMKLEMLCRDFRGQGYFHTIDSIIVNNLLRFLITIFQ